MDPPNGFDEKMGEELKFKILYMKIYVLIFIYYSFLLRHVKKLMSNYNYTILFSYSI
jgi:hypothetical protein